MGVSTSHQISKYYDFFRDKEIVFTKANLRSLKMDPRQIYLKCNGGQWPCIINSSSLQVAKVIVGTSSGVYQEISKKQNVPISLRYCFFDQNNEPIQFFVNCTVIEKKSYQGSNDLAMVTLEFTSRPPDDLILKIGEFLEVNDNFNTRKEERIGINKNSLRLLSIPKEETYIFITGVPRRCILKDLSFGGARIMLVGIPKFLEGKTVDLRLFFSDTGDKVSLVGVVKNADFLPGRQDICIAHIEFIADEIPMAYKFHINTYITSYQKQLIQNQLKNEEAAAKAEEENAAKSAARAEAQAKAAAENAAKMAAKDTVGKNILQSAAIKSQQEQSAPKPQEAPATILPNSHPAQTAPSESGQNAQPSSASETPAPQTAQQPADSNNA